MKAFLFVPVVMLLGGCSILEPMPDSGQPTPIQLNLSDLLQDYRLPAQSIPPSTNSDPQVDAAIHSMQRIATVEGLVFDGSRTAEGTVIVGRMGSADQMVLAIAVYPKDGRVAMQDAFNWKLSDMSKGNRMRDRYLNALRQPPAQ
jgi:hypothetical protein